MIVPNSEKGKPPGVLTRKKLDRWCADHNQRYVHSVRAWRRFESADFAVLEKFLSFPVQVQTLLVCETVSPYEVNLMTKYFSLLEIAEREHPDSGLCADITGTYKVRQLCAEYPPLASEQFKKEYALFIDSDLNSLDSLWRDYARSIPGLLKVVYGHDTALELMIGWNHNQISATLYDLILVAEHGEEFGTLPFEWALSLVKGSNEGTSTESYGLA